MQARSAAAMLSGAVGSNERRNERDLKPDLLLA